MFFPIPDPLYLIMRFFARAKNRIFTKKVNGYNWVMTAPGNFFAFFADRAGASNLAALVKNRVFQRVF